MHCRILHVFLMCPLPLTEHQDIHTDGILQDRDITKETSWFHSLT